MDALTQPERNRPLAQQNAAWLGCRWGKGKDRDIQSCSIPAASHPRRKLIQQFKTVQVPASWYTAGSLLCRAVCDNLDGMGTPEHGPHHGHGHLQSCAYARLQAVLSSPPVAARAELVQEERSSEQCQRHSRSTRGAGGYEDPAWGWERITAGLRPFTACSKCPNSHIKQGLSLNTCGREW